MTKEEIVERIKVLAQDAENAPKDELNSLRLQSSIKEFFEFWE